MTFTTIGDEAPSECKTSRSSLLEQLKELANELDKGCCDECCRDSSRRRRERDHPPNPCPGMKPPFIAAGTDQNRSRWALQRVQQTLDGRPMNDGGSKFRADEEFDGYPPARSNSRQEQRGGPSIHMGCDCCKRNGLQDESQRCCDDCCLDSPFRRKEREERPNPCLGAFPPQNTPVPPGMNPNRRGRALERNRQTLDGRPVDDGRAQFEAEEEFDRYPTPPWYKPRSKSQELRAGFFHIGCDCYKRNGLQDDCQRSHCGLPECLYRPPECEPSTFSPLTGVRIPTMQANQYHNYNRY